MKKRKVSIPYADMLNGRRALFGQVAVKSSEQSVTLRNSGFDQGWLTLLSAPYMIIRMLHPDFQSSTARGQAAGDMLARQSDFFRAKNR